MKKTQKNKGDQVAVADKPKASPFIIKKQSKKTDTNPDLKKNNKITSKREQEERRKKTLKKQLNQKKSEVYDRKKLSTQDFLNYDRIMEDGICVVKEDLLYSKTIEFTDVNYRILSESKQEEIFTSYVKLLNSFDSNFSYQITLKNELIDFDDFKNEVTLEAKNDDKQIYRNEYNEIILDKARQGVNTVRRRKFITFSVVAGSLDEARRLLNQAEESLLSSLKGIYPIHNIEMVYKPLNGLERIELLKSFLDPKGKEDKSFDYVKQHSQMLTSKDFLAADFADFSDNNIYQWGKYFGQVHYFKDFPAELSDQFLTDLVSESINMSVSIYAQSYPQDEALKLIQQKMTWMSTQKFSEKRKLSGKIGGDTDEFVSKVLQDKLEEATFLNQSLSRDSQRLFSTSFIVETMAETIEDLMDNVYRIESVCRKYGITLGDLVYQQKSAFNSALPLGYNLLDLSRTLNSNALGNLIPFSTQELYDSTGLYYGVNAISKNLVMLDRRLRKNPSGMIMATPGSGKSFSAKKEIVSVLLSSDDDIIIVDPEGEYSEVVRNFGGEVIKIGPTSRNYINPLDLNTDYTTNKDNPDDEDDEDETIEDPISIKSQFMVSFFSLISQVGDNQSMLSANEITIIDRIINKIYKQYLSDPLNNKKPNLRTFYNMLRDQGDFDSTNLAKTLELYVEGSQNIFSHDSNVEINNRLLSFDILEIGDNQLKKLALLIMMDYLWNRIVYNKQRGKRTWLYMDEFYLILGDPLTSAFLYKLFKRSRKYNGIITGITQNVSDMFQTQESRTMFNNSTGYVLLLNQSEDDLATLTMMYNLSDEQKKYIYQAPSGSGILISEGKIIPISDKFPKNTKLYKMMTTSGQDLIAYKQQDQARINSCKELLDKYAVSKEEVLKASIMEVLDAIEDKKQKQRLVKRFVDIENRSDNEQDTVQTDKDNMEDI